MSDFRDAQWTRDFEEALAMLNGALPRQLLLPPPAPARPTLTPFSVPVIPTEHDPDSRADLLNRIRVVRMPRPGLRLVYLDGAMVGRIAKSPYQIGWLASCTRSTLYWSIADAVCALVEDMIEASR